MKKKTAAQLPTSGKAMPHIEEAEKAVISALLHSAPVWDDFNFLKPEMFYIPLYRLLFEAMVSLRKKESVIDIITVFHEILSMGKEKEASAYIITNISHYTSSALHLIEHAWMVKQKYIQRCVILFASSLQQKAFDDMNDIADVLFDAGKDLETLMEEMVGDNGISSYEDISHMFYEDINIRMNKFGSNQQTGTDTGFKILNNLTAGWQPSELIILAGRPAMGKTALALHFAHSATRQNVPVVMFSLEMSKVDLYKRSILSVTDEVDSAHLKSGDLANDLPHIDKAVTQLYQLPFYVDDNANVNMQYIRSQCRLLHKKNKCKLVIIDYLQLISPGNTKYGNREQEISAMSRDAKLLAKELDIPVILLSQLNRDVEKRIEKRPQLSDLRESGAIEQDADMVVFVHRPEYYKQHILDDAGNPVDNVGELIISKYRHGSTGTLKFRHNDSLTMITDYA